MPRRRSAAPPAGWSSWKKGGRLAAGRRTKPSAGPSRWPGPNSAGPINLLRLENVDFGEGSPTVRVGNQLLHLPSRESGKPLPSFVQFSPTDVMLARQEVAGLSARNHLHGKVCRVISVGQAVFVAVDIGQILWAEVTSQAAVELGVQPGLEVTCLVKTHSLIELD